MYVWIAISTIADPLKNYRSRIGVVLVGKRGSSQHKVPDKLALVAWNEKYQCWEHTITGGKLNFEPTHLLLLEPIPETKEEADARQAEQAHPAS